MRFVIALATIPIVFMSLIGLASESPISRSEFFYHHLPHDTDYRDQRNTLSATREDYNKGKIAFETYCVPCHGFTGIAPEPEADSGEISFTHEVEIKPPPAAPRLLQTTQELFATDRDAYLFWTIAEGGHPVGSQMPAFKETLSPTRIWQTIMYINEISKF